jgi:FKBP-type peptidyl-prolyl cis-trans isomerase
MKRKLYLLVSLLVVVVTGLFIVIRVVNSNKDENCKIVIKDIQVISKTDTLSYALGYVWANNLRRFAGMNTVTYAFYLGVNDYFKRDSSIMGIYDAAEYADNKAQSITSKKWPRNDSIVKLCNIELNTEFDTFSYALGYAWSRGAYGIGLSEVSPALITGMFTSFYANQSIFSNYDAANSYLMNYIEELRSVKFASIRQANEQWLKDNSAHEGVISLASGLQYKILKSGHGKAIAPEDIIESHYVSKLIDGSIFENYSNNPYKFYQFAIIKGAGEALKLMKIGDEWELYIPYDLAYGSGGVNNKIPPYSTVIVNLEILNAIPAESKNQ